jgi:outer membrane receptor protein involved in Fe transport
VNAALEWKALEDLALLSKLGYFAEDENGGTHYTTASVRSFGYALGARSGGPSWGSVEATFFGHLQSFKQNRARTTADRSSEALAASQSVPVDDEGLAVIWRSAQLNWAGTHRASGGIELRRIYGTANEDDFPATPTPTSVLHRESRGEQRLLGVFAEDSYEPVSALEFVGALRFDLWKNLHARQLTMDATSTTETALADRSDQQLSPKLGARYRPLEWLTLRASGYGAFRAPTLNECTVRFRWGRSSPRPTASLGRRRCGAAKPASRSRRAPPQTFGRTPLGMTFVTRLPT